MISEGSRVYSAEAFAAHFYEQRGYQTLILESTPFHALFAVFMWLSIQDPSDPLVRLVGFGDRFAYEQNEKGKEIWTMLPEDFGTSGYAKRRADAIERHFGLVPCDQKELFWAFDYWVEPSSNLGQYLWAHRPQDIERARYLLTVLPVDAIHRILRYLVADYWQRYTGWPDLLVHKRGEYFLAEVKSSKDKLREAQKNWICANTAELYLPFKLVKIHRKAT